MTRIAYSLLLSLLVCMALLYFVPHTGTGVREGGMLVLFNIFGLTAVLFLIVSSKRERSAAYIFCLYVISFYLIPGFAHVSLRQFPLYNLDYSNDQIMLSAAVVTIFSTAWAIGYSITKSRLDKRARAPRFIAPRTVILLISLVYVSLALTIAFAVGLNYYTVTRRDAADELMAIVTPILTIETTAPRILSFLALVLAIMAIRRRADVWAIGLSLTTLGAFLVLNSPLAIARFVLFSYLISLALTFTNLLVKRKIAFLILSVFFQLTVFPLVSVLSRGDIEEFLSEPLSEYYISNGDFDGFQSTINVVSYAQATGLKLGVHLLSALVFFLPREYWKGKSGGTGGDAAQWYGYDFTNISAPLPSEFYVDFGVLGVLVGGALLGYILAKVDGAIREARRSNDQLRLLHYSVVVGYLFIILRGSLVAIVGPFVFTYAMVWITRLLARLARADRPPVHKAIFADAGRSGTENEKRRADHS